MAVQTAVSTGDTILLVTGCFGEYGFGRTTGVTRHSQCCASVCVTQSTLLSVPADVRWPRRSAMHFHAIKHDSDEGNTGGVTVECTSTTLGSSATIICITDAGNRTTFRSCQERIVAHNYHSSSSFASMLLRPASLSSTYLAGCDVFHISHRAPSQNPTGCSKPLALFPCALHMQSWQLRSHRVGMVLFDHGRWWSLSGRGLSSEGEVLWQLCSVPVETRIGPRAHFHCHLHIELSCCDH